MKKNKYFLALIFVFVQSATYAQLVSYSNFSPLKKFDKETWVDIRLTPEMLSKSKSNLHDFKLYAVSKTDTTEIPYVMEWMGYKVVETEIPFETLPENKNDDKATYINIKMKDKAYVNDIKFDIEEKNYEKSVKILGSNDNENWQTIIDKSRIAAHFDELESYNYSTVFFNTGGFMYYRLIIDNQTSPAVKINEISLNKHEEFPGVYGQLNNFKTKTTHNKVNQTSEVEIDFNGNYYINQIEIIPAKKQADFHRHINIHYLTTEGLRGGTKEHYTLANSGIVTSSKPNFLDCYNDRTHKIKLEILNKNNEPIKIDSIKVFYEVVRLLAKLPAKEQVLLVYGKEKEPKPVYDLAYFTDKIPTDLEQINSLTEYEQVRMMEVVSPLIESKNWLWAIMLVVIVVIGFFAIKLLRKS
ncbi:MAG: hypothetical protein V4667_02915 [Bacteroidota bacterium]